MIQLVRPTETMKEQAIEFRKEFFEHGEFVINGSELFEKKGICYGNAAAIIRGCQKGGDERTVSFCGKEE